MKTRITAGLIAGFLLIWLVFAGPLPLISAVVFFCSAAAYLEFDKLFFPERDPLRQFRGACLTTLTVLAISEPGAGWIALWFCLVFLGVSRVLQANRGGDIPTSVKALAIEMLGYLYVVGLFGFLVPVVKLGPFGREYLFLLFCIVFGTDTAAYFVGMKWGKHRLAPTISPKKSVEGAVGGILGAVLMSAVWLVIFRGGAGAGFVVRLLLFSVLGSVLAQFGDLLESLLKRSQAQKDSGQFLPGHGGLLDRIDGLIFVAPVYYYYLMYFLEIP